jgi:hypothetical protein
MFSPFCDVCFEGKANIAYASICTLGFVALDFCEADRVCFFKLCATGLPALGRCHGATPHRAAQNRHDGAWVERTLSACARTSALTRGLTFVASLVISKTALHKPIC